MKRSQLITQEASVLATELIKQDRLTMRQLQQGLEWCARNQEPLVVFLERFAAAKCADSAPAPDPDERQRREFARQPTTRALWIEAEQKLIEVHALNVSRGGLAFQGRWALERGSLIQIGSDQQVQAVVRYCVDNGNGTATCGAEFAPKTMDELQAIEALLLSLAAKTRL